jgi:N-acetylmuramoyl-L-alanine amidase
LRHVIERGDTLSEIAEAHGLDLEALVRLNGVDPDRPIRPGEALKLSPGGPPRPKLYVAKAGDTLAKVARHFGVSEKALLEANRMEARRLNPGQKLVLPR